MQDLWNQPEKRALFAIAYVPDLAEPANRATTWHDFMLAARRIMPIVPLSDMIS
ncbi:MAG: hypothetical protein NVSMB42_08270 [Herpetosiphon sp.]